MTKTEPDFLTPGLTVVGPNNEISEVPARLGSPVVLRRGGRVIYYDAFTSLIPWYIQTAGATIDTTVSYRGTACLKMTPAASAPEINKLLPYMANRSIGLSVNFGFNSTTADSTVDLLMYYLMNGNIIGAEVKVYLATGQIKAGSTVIATYTLKKISNPIVWYNIKFIVDCVNQKITRVQFNELDILCNVSISGSVGAAPYWGIVMITAAVTNNTPVYYSDLVITVDEPIQ